MMKLTHCSLKIFLTMTLCLIAQSATCPGFSAISDRGTYLVRWKPLEMEEVPLNAPFDMDITILRAGDGRAADVKVTVGALMPAHHHGMSVEPEMLRKGPGHWLARGVLLFMPGEWRLTFDVANGSEVEQAVSDIKLAEEGADAMASVSAAEARKYLALFSSPDAPVDPTNRYARDPQAARLGKALFFDPRLSGSGTVSCSSCHQPARNWTDGRAMALGVRETDRNTPTLWNVADRRWFFWDGRVATLWSQALRPIEAPAEMGGSRLGLVRLLSQDRLLRELYRAAFGQMPAQSSVDRVFANSGKALAAFETTLIARHSPFDRFLSCVSTGQPETCHQLSVAELSGLRLFTGRVACVNCHHGRDLTDEEFHDILLPRAQPGRNRGIAAACSDPFGPATRFSDARDSIPALFVRTTRVRQALEYAFRTPSLRQVALTAPYMHNGIYRDLKAVLEHYSTLSDAPANQVDGETLIRPLHLTDAEMRTLAAFLSSLTSE